MANRPIYCSILDYPYVKVKNIDFDWFSGFSKTQKQKSISSLHKNFNMMYPNIKVLEISSKSDKSEGVNASAFNLMKYVPYIDKSVSVENIFQSSKVFEDGGPYKDLLTVSPKEAKKRIKELATSKLISFNFKGRDYPLIPKTIFYDYIYMNALLENKELLKEIVTYDAFTDIEFNPNKSINCQAKAAATFVSLYRLGKTEQIKDFDCFLKLMVNN